MRRCRLRTTGNSKERVRGSRVKGNVTKTIVYLLFTHPHTQAHTRTHTVQVRLVVVITRCLDHVADDLMGNVRRSLNAGNDLVVIAGLARFVAWAIAMCHAGAARRLAGLLALNT